jgi:hypothetical protein
VLVPPPAPPAAAPAPVVMPAVSEPAYQPYPPAAHARAPYGSAGRVVFAGVVLFLFGLSEALGGAVGAVAASSLRKLFDQLLRNEGLRIETAALTSLLTGIFVTMLVLGILHMIVAGGVFAHRGWGRWLGAILALLGSVLGAWLTFRVATDQGAHLSSYVAPVAILVPYLVTLLALLFPGDHFRRKIRSG